jgi:hypothetical protein
VVGSQPQQFIHSTNHNFVSDRDTRSNGKDRGAVVLTCAYQT